MAGRPTLKRTCAPPVLFRAMPENEIPPVIRGDIYLMVMVVMMVMMVVVPCVGLIFNVAVHFVAVFAFIFKLKCRVTNAVFL